ncbi:MAG: L-proline 4-hydroxylase [Pirellulaceae bacterium]|nr:MAG: L-proline 4-hydroxylase [Pirellulaceae bacterium]
MVTDGTCRSTFLPQPLVGRQMPQPSLAQPAPLAMTPRIHEESPTVRYYRTTPADVSQFQETGYVVVPNLLHGDEVALLRQVAKKDAQIRQRATTRSDARGAATTLALSNEVEDDLYSHVTRLRRIVDAMTQFLGDEVYHYHHKMMLKDAYVGGAWEWHQDYGYWYNFGCLWPRMASCFIAIDRATRENGCLQVIPGSHHIGRIDHGKVGEQTGADPERVAAALERMEVQFVELAPGDAIFFHCNLLHRSDANTSPEPRWSLICCYNTRSNSPYKPSRHPFYQPLEVLEDESLLPLAQQAALDISDDG